MSSLSLSPKLFKTSPQFSRSCAKQEATIVNFVQIYSQIKTEVIMTETAVRERGGEVGAVILPFSLLSKLLSFTNEINTLPILILGH